MFVRQFNSHSDLPELQTWLIARKLNPVPASELPALGFVVPGVACAFVRAIEGNYCLMDSLASNPAASAETRNAALEMLFNAVLAGAQGRAILGITVDDGTLVRAQAFGFKKSDHVLLVLKPVG